MRRLEARGVLLCSLALLSLPLAVSARIPLQPGRQVTVEFSVNPARVNSQVVLTATVTPTTTVRFTYRFFVDGQLVCGGWQDSAKCPFVPQQARTYYVNAEAQQVAVAPGGRRGAPEPRIWTSSRLPLEVLPEAPPPEKPRPFVLTLKLASARVVAGESASFVVSVEGASELPEYVFTASDGSDPQPLRAPTFSHVYSQAGRASATVSLPSGAGRSSVTFVVAPAPVRPVPPGVTGTGPPVIVNVPDPAFPWTYVALGVVVLVGAVLIGRATRKPARPHVATTLHPHPQLQPSFNPSKPRGISLEVRFVPNLARMRFTSRVLIGRKD